MSTWGAIPVRLLIQWVSIGTSIREGVLRRLFQLEPHNTTLVGGPQMICSLPCTITIFGGRPAEYLILGGDFLTFVQGQSEQVRLYEDVDERLSLDARYMLATLGCNQRDRFSDHGSRTILADLSSPNVRLSLQRYTVYWHATCDVVKCHVRMDECPDHCGSKALYVCDVAWTLYDYYDFPWWMGPWQWAGSPFHIFAYWNRPASGDSAEMSQ